MLNLFPVHPGAPKPVGADDEMAALADQRGDFAMLRPMRAPVDAMLAAIGVARLAAAFPAESGLSHSNHNFRRGYPLRLIQHRRFARSRSGGLRRKLRIALGMIFVEEALERRVRGRAREFLRREFIIRRTSWTA